MKSIFSAGQVQGVLVNEIQNPGKEFLDDVATGRFTLSDIRKGYKILRAMATMPEPDKENTKESNSQILIDIRDEFFRHLNIPQQYKNIFRLVINYVIAKYGYDNFYKESADWWLGEMLRRGFVLPAHNRPSSVLWDTIPMTTRGRLKESITNNYALLQERLKVINEKFKDSEEGNIHRASRYEQFVNRVLTDVEREVIAWEG